MKVTMIQPLHRAKTTQFAIPRSWRIPQRLDHCTSCLSTLSIRIDHTLKRFKIGAREKEYHADCNLTLDLSGQLIWLGGYGFLDLETDSPQSGPDCLDRLVLSNGTANAKINICEDGAAETKSPV